MKLEEVIGLFLGNIKDVYRNPDLSRPHKRRRIASAASDVFRKKRQHVNVIFVSSEERAVCDVMESYSYYSVDRVEVKLASRKKAIIYLEELRAGHELYGSYTIIVGDSVMNENFSWYY